MEDRVWKIAWIVVRRPDDPSAPLEGVLVAARDERTAFRIAGEWLATTRPDLELIRPAFIAEQRGDRSILAGTGVAGFEIAVKDREAAAQMLRLETEIHNAQQRDIATVTSGGQPSAAIEVMARQHRDGAWRDSEPWWALIVRIIQPAFYLIAPALLIASLIPPVVRWLITILIAAGIIWLIGFR